MLPCIWNLPLFVVDKSAYKMRHSMDRLCYVDRPGRFSGACCQSLEPLVILSCAKMKISKTSVQQSIPGKKFSMQTESLGTAFFTCDVTPVHCHFHIEGCSAWSTLHSQVTNATKMFRAFTELHTGSEKPSQTYDAVHYDALPYDEAHHDAFHYDAYCPPGSWIF